MGCITCGSPLKGLQKKFCGKRCNDRYRSTVLDATIVCVYCGRTKSLPKKQAPEQRYCSLSCSRAHFNTQYLTGARNGRWRGGRALNYGPGWKQIKEAVRARDKFCRHCGKTPEENGRALDVHHINPFRFSNDHDMANLVALCRSCHMRADDHGRRGHAEFLRAVGEPKRPTKREIRSLRALAAKAQRNADRKHLQSKAIEQAAQGRSLREISEDLQVSHQTVANWLRGNYLAREGREPYVARLVS